MILDTCALSALLAGDEALVELVSSVEKQTLPAVVLGEYRFGMARSRIRRDLDPVLDELESESTILRVDENTAKHYADVKEGLRCIGKPIPENDLWIAALARQHNMPVVTRDDHFRHVTDLRTVGW